MSHEPFSDLARKRLSDGDRAEKIQALCRRMERLYAVKTIDREAEQAIQAEARALGVEIIDFTPESDAYSATWRKL